MSHSRHLLLAALVAVCAAPCPASAFERSKVPSTNIDLFWCVRDIPFITNASGSKHAGTGTFEAVSDSFITWGKVSGADIAFTDQGVTARVDIGYDQTATDNINLVVWREVNCSDVVPSGDDCLDSGDCNNKYGCWDHSSQIIALTTTTFDNKTGEIYDADIEVNGSGFTFTTVGGLPPCSDPPPADTSGCIATDIRNTITHEAGHVLGLAHPCVVGASCVDPHAAMMATAVIGDLNKRTLTEDDQNGATTIYPLAGPTVGCQKPNVLIANGCGCNTSGGPLLAAAGMVLLLLGARRRKAGCRRS